MKILRMIQVMGTLVDIWNINMLEYAISSPQIFYPIEFLAIICQKPPRFIVSSAIKKIHIKFEIVKTKEKIFLVLQELGSDSNMCL